MMTSTSATAAAVSLAVLFVSFQPNPAVALVRDSINGVADLSEVQMQTGSRNLLAHMNETMHTPSPAPGPATNASLFHNAATNASGPAGVRNVTSFASVGTAVNPSKNIAGGSATSGKTAAFGSVCVIFSSGTTASCENEIRPVPACCTSQSNSATCATYDNGGRVTCSTSAAPYPSCCENRNQPRSVCTTPTSSSSLCGADYPVPACCDSTSCSVFSSGNSVQCTGGRVARCCPS